MSTAAKANWRFGESCSCWPLQGSYDRRPRQVHPSNRTPRPPAVISGMGQIRTSNAYQTAGSLRRFWPKSVGNLNALFDHLNQHGIHVCKRAI
jgi:hypothetical protein